MATRAVRREGRHVNRKRVQRLWRDEGLKRAAATAAEMINAQRSFRRVKGYKKMPVLVAALGGHTEVVTRTCKNEEAA